MIDGAAGVLVNAHLVPSRIRPPEPLGKEWTSRRHNSAFSSNEGAIVTLSPEAQTASAAAAEKEREARPGEPIFDRLGQADGSDDGAGKGAEASTASQGKPAEGTAAEGTAAARGPKSPGELTQEEQQVVNELRARDAEVRAHEAAHAGAAGSLGGSPSYSFETGPDGRQYATGGEVHIDVSQGATPEETISKAQQVRAAALAPASPSSQDRAVAASAAAMEQKARAEISRKRTEASNETGASKNVAGGAEPPAESGSTEAAFPAKTIAREDPFGAAAVPEDKADPDRLMMSLASERTQAYGNYGHAHADAGCGFCGKAAASYR